MHIPKSKSPTAYGNIPHKEYRRVPRTMFEAFGRDCELVPMADPKAARRERFWTMLLFLLLVAMSITSCIMPFHHP